MYIGLCERMNFFSTEMAFLLTVLQFPRSNFPLLSNFSSTNFLLVPFLSLELVSFQKKKKNTLPQCVSIRPRNQFFLPFTFLQRITEFRQFDIMNSNRIMSKNKSQGSCSFIVKLIDWCCVKNCSCWAFFFECHYSDAWVSGGDWTN